jgi:hypothetical protein
MAVALSLSSPAVLAEDPSGEAWRQWGGPNRNFIVDATGLAEKWPDGGPPVLWSRPLGTGHSAILVDERNNRISTTHPRCRGQSSYSLTAAGDSHVGARLAFESRPNVGNERDLEEPERAMQDLT